MKFQKNLVVWKHRKLSRCEYRSKKFQKNLVVWKLISFTALGYFIAWVSEELSSVETSYSPL